MDRLKATNSVAFANRDTAPVSGTAQYATDGDPSTSTPPTIWPAYASNMLIDEMIAVIVAAGLTPDDTDWTQLLKAQRLLFAPAQLHTQIITAGGTFIVPASQLEVELVGAGGGGGGTDGTLAGGCGGAGGYSRRLISGLTVGASITVTVPGGSAGGVGALNGSAGGTTSFGAYLSATGGQGGVAVGTAAGGTGGGGTGGDINIIGGCGSDGAPTDAPGEGLGGVSYFGGGGRHGSAGGLVAGAYGSGGGGAYGLASNGGAGKAGVIIVRWRA
jgi:hypothetical protein